MEYVNRHAHTFSCVHKRGVSQTHGFAWYTQPFVLLPIDVVFEPIGSNPSGKPANPALLSLCQGCLWMIVEAAQGSSV